MMKYRADIDGLRAIAVLAVIFYHIGFTSVFKSGYVGVDVFFVISGYLITSILYSSIKFPSSNGDKHVHFSLLDFYERRMRRILPVFFLVVLMSLFLGHFFFTARENDDLTNSIFSVLGFGANYFFWGDDNYFSIKALSKPLLHMWSLAIEEQFYICFPLLLILLIKKNKSVIKYISLITLFSFVSCVIVSWLSQKTAFYWLPFRAWELLLGSLLAVCSLSSGENLKLLQIEKEWKIQILSLVTLALLLFSITSLEVISTVFPSYVALFPCLATLLCIEIGKNPKSLIYKILSLPVLVGVGKISYSLYLWHWVFIAYFHANFMSVGTLTLQQKMICLVLTFLFSLVFYFLLEQPIRHKRILKKQKTFFVSIALILVGLFILTLAVKKQIIPNRPNFYDQYASCGFTLSSENFVDNIQGLHFFGSASCEPTLFVIGDSHAAALYEMLDLLAIENNVSGVMYTSQTPLLNTVDPSNVNINLISPSSILEEQSQLKEYLSRQNIKSVLFILRWTLRMYGKTLVGNKPVGETHTLYYINEDASINKDSIFAVKKSIEDTRRFFAKEDTQFYYQKALPEFLDFVPSIATYMSREFGFSDIRVKVSTPYSEYENLHAETFKELSHLKEQGFYEINLTDKLCDTNYCYGLNEEKIPLYSDADHLSRIGAMYVKDEFLPFIISGKRE